MLTQITATVDAMRERHIHDGSFYDAYRRFLAGSMDLYATLDELYASDPEAKKAYNAFIEQHGTLWRAE